MRVPVQPIIVSLVAMIMVACNAPQPDLRELASQEPETVTPTAANGLQSASPLSESGSPFGEQALISSVALLGKGEIHSMQYSSTAQRLVLGSSRGIYVYDAANLREVAFLDPDAVTSYWKRSSGSSTIVTMSRQDQLIASSFLGGDPMLWNATDGAFLGALAGHEGIVTALTFSPDGRVLASASEDRTVRLWRVGDGKPLATLTHAGVPTILEFSPDGAVLATACGFRGGPVDVRDRDVYLWDTSDGALLGKLDRHNDEVSSVAFSPDGRTLATAAGDDPVRLWSVAEGSFLRVLDGDYGVVNDVAFSPDSSMVAVGGFAPMQIGIWNAGDGTLVHGHESGGVVKHVVFSPDGSSLVTVGDTGAASALWSTSDGVPLYTLWEHRGAVLAVSFSDDGQTLVSASTDAVQLRRSRDGSLLGTIDGYSSEPAQVALSYDGDTFAYLAYDGVRVLNTSDWSSRGTIGTDAGAALLLDMALSPDGSTVATLQGNDSSSTKAFLWRVDGTLSSAGMIGDLESAGAIALSHDAQILASWPHYGDAIRLWHVPEKSLLFGLEWEGIRPTAVAFSEDGSIVAGGFENGMIRLWRTSDGVLLSTLEGQRSGITNMAFLPNAGTLASASENGAVWIRNIGDDSTFLVVDGDLPDVEFLSFSSDGSYLMGGGRYGDLRLWCVSDGSLVGRDDLDRRLQRISSWAFSPLSQMLITGYEDGTIEVLRVASIGDKCSRAVRPTVEVAADLPLDQEDRYIIAEENVVELRETAKLGIRGFYLAYHPEGHILAVATSDGVLLLDAVSLQDIGVIEPGASISPIVFSPDGQYLAGGLGSKVGFWDTSTRELVHIVGMGSTGIKQLTFSTDGTALYGLSMHGLLYQLQWPLEEGVSAETLGVQATYELSATSPDGKTTAYGYQDGSVRLRWQRDSAVLGRLHQGGVTSMTFSPDGQLLATGSTDGTVGLLRVSDGALLHTLHQSEPVGSIAFSPDGKTLAVASLDYHATDSHFITFWRITPAGERPDS